ncbi:MAG: hypothetical protein COB50_00830 [Thiotrichales bacterium]|nr:MAG: hypothetical protein COB50_00830 [Thiotrichales bacterium]
MASLLFQIIEVFAMCKPINVLHVKGSIISTATKIFATEGCSINLADFCKKIAQPVSLIKVHYPNIESIITGVILTHITLCETQIFSINNRSDLIPKERLQLFCEAILDYFSVELNSLLFARIYELDYESLNSGISMATKRYDSLWYDAIYNLFVPLLGSSLATDMADGSMALLSQAAKELQEHKYHKSVYTLNSYCTELISNWQRVEQNKNHKTKRCIAWIAPHEHRLSSQAVIDNYLKKHNLNYDAIVFAQGRENIFHLVAHTLQPGDKLVITSASSISFIFTQILHFMSITAEHKIELHFAKYNRNLEGESSQHSDTLMEVTADILEEIHAITES